MIPAPNASVRRGEQRLMMESAGVPQGGNAWFPDIPQILPHEMVQAGIARNNPAKTG